MRMWTRSFSADLFPKNRSRERICLYQYRDCFILPRRIAMTNQALRISIKKFTSNRTVLLPCCLGSTDWILRMWFLRALPPSEFVIARPQSFCPLYKYFLNQYSQVVSRIDLSSFRLVRNPVTDSYLQSKAYASGSLVRHRKLMPQD